jgi:hypothetical protein
MADPRNQDRNHVPELAPSYLPRQQRRRISRQIYKLLHGDVCSICGSPLKHNSQTTSGLDTHGNVAVAGECCADRVAVIFGLGHYVTRNYDFLPSPSASTGKSNIQSTNEQIVTAIAASQKAVADTDKWMADIERRGGGPRARYVSLGDQPWKKDDADWFEQNPKRSHRARLPFPSEADKEAVGVSGRVHDGHAHTSGRVREAAEDQLLSQHRRTARPRRRSHHPRPVRGGCGT